ncbi:hypothetical protein V9R55_000694 [Vibrio cholerae]|uniref:hypothetical protein n=1 Tax=Vibrio cholerae TaxID=666 RepID=UPI0010FCE9BE|nr:hypothetical protein [Vibrio cholerae]EGQ7789037.1 hypothetical protein [Vibrio cholerae]EHS1093373.1 hypothetical protein [Vibrio cholerae]EJH6265617.1 hypothetical protein [Vibrio cholerae]EJL6417538.1 hypothetical protein [Vibrio cholerae]EJL7179062.1 hypothetical protein [Vibrio cholerae]
MSNQNGSQLPASKEANDQIIVERYKYILEKIKFLDDKIYQNFSSSIKLITSLTAVLTASVMSISEGKISDVTFLLSIKFIFSILVLFSIYMIITSLSITLSWYDYRKEEVELLNKINCDINRYNPKLSSFIRWSETYYVVFLVAMIIVGIYTIINSEWILSAIGE